MPQQVSGVILAGGTSRRMGRDKAFLLLAGLPMIEAFSQRLRAVVDEVIIVADDTQRYSPFTDRCVPDVYPGIGTLGGIHAGLLAASHELALVVGCDMPFLNPDVLAWLVDAAGGVDLIAFRHRLGMEPLHAVYRKSCLPAVEGAIRSGERCAFAFHDQIRVRYMSPAEIPSLDPGLGSFYNVNTPDQWREARTQTRTQDAVTEVCDSASVVAPP
jgi:molybdopterin-guanine dinucleotide biosynthesis protein A